MGIDDGIIIGINKILDNGSNDTRFNIVVIAEGFTKFEQKDFDEACNELVSMIRDEPWFPFLGGAINIHRLNVSSNESGANDPLNCADGRPGSGQNVATYFDAAFCNAGIRRCLMGDNVLVRDTLDLEIPEWHAGVVLVNTTRRGGCASGDVSWTSLASNWRDVVLHELGHSMGLGDEYDCWTCTQNENDRDRAPPGEPVQPNITTVTGRELKWSRFVFSFYPPAPIPTMQNPDCTQRDRRPNILDDDLKIGLFEGALYYHCGRYRPAYNCKMRTSSQPFCRVCIEGIANRLSPFMGSISLPFMDIENLFSITLPWRSQVRNNDVKEMIVSNKGNGELLWRIIPGSNTHFRIDSRFFSWQRLQGNSKRRVEISFNPPSDGFFVDNIKVESNFEYYSIGLFGQGYFSCDDLVFREDHTI